MESTEIAKRICKSCGKEFSFDIKHKNKQSYCSYECKKNAIHDRWEVKAEKKREQKAKETNGYKKVCLICGNEYKAQPASYSKSRFCSRTCRNEFYKTDQYKLEKLQRKQTIKKVERNTLAKISELAKAEGISYGDYVVKYNL